MAALTADIRMIVGLGNPGADYVDTRHNAGFWLIDLIAAEEGAGFRFEKRHERARPDADDLDHAPGSRALDHGVSVGVKAIKIKVRVAVDPHRLVSLALKVSMMKIEWMGKTPRGSAS